MQFSIKDIIEFPQKLFGKQGYVLAVNKKESGLELIKPAAIAENSLKINGIKITISATPPIKPQVNDLWIDIN